MKTIFRRFRIIVSGICTLALVICMINVSVNALVRFGQESWLHQSGASANGFVDSLYQTTDKGTTNYHIHYGFQAPDPIHRNPRMYPSSITVRDKHFYNNLEMGSTIVVRYDANDPSINTLDAVARPASDAVFLVLLALVSASLPIIYVARFPKIAAEWTRGQT